MRVGEKEISEQAAIVERYADLFTRPQLEALRAAEERQRDGASASASRGCGSPARRGSSTRELDRARGRAPERDARRPRPWEGEELPLRAAQARLATAAGLSPTGTSSARVRSRSRSSFNDERRALLAARDELEAELSGDADAVARNEAVKGISLAADRRRGRRRRASTARTAWTPLRERWLDRLLGTERDEVPTASHIAWIRRLSPLAGDVHEGARRARLPRDACGRSGFEIEDEPRHPARPRRPAAEVAARVRDPVRPAAASSTSSPARRAGCTTTRRSSTRPVTRSTTRAATRRCRTRSGASARDHALTEIYSYIVESISREPGWHAEHFGLVRRGGRARTRRRALFSRRSCSGATRRSSGSSSTFWDRFPSDGGTSGRLRGAAHRGDGHPLPARRTSSPTWMPGFYSADYLRAWIRAAQLRAHLRARGRRGLVALSRAPASSCASCSARGRGRRPRRSPSRIGFDPLDTRPLVAEMTV